MSSLPPKPPPTGLMMKRTLLIGCAMMRDSMWRWWVMFWLGERMVTTPSWIDVGEAGLRLQIGVLDLLGGVDLLDDQVGFGEALLDIADADRDVLDDVVGRIVVQHRRAGPQRLVGIEHRRQRLVDDLDLCDSARRATSGSSEATAATCSPT